MCDMKTVSSREMHDREYGYLSIFQNGSDPDGYDMSNVVVSDTYPYDE